MSVPTDAQYPYLLASPVLPRSLKMSIGHSVYYCRTKMSRNLNRCSVQPNNLIVHRADAVLITDRSGMISRGMEGFYLHQTRFLSRLQLRVEGSTPHFVSANAVDHYFITAYHLAPSPAGARAGPTPEREIRSHSEIVKKGIELQVNAFCGGGLHLDITLTNRALLRAAVTLSLALEADFADMTEAQSGKRQQRAPVERHWVLHPSDGKSELVGELHLDYRHPDLRLGTRIRLSGADELMDQRSALRCRLHLEPQKPRPLSVDVIALYDQETVGPAYGRQQRSNASCTVAKVQHAWNQQCAQLSASNPWVQSAWDRAVSDLAALQLLDGEDAEPFVVVGGIPKYTGLFGRDAYFSALQSAILNPLTLRGTLQVLSRWNAGRTDDRYDAQPGKVLHQRERGPLAQLGKTPFLHYYGDHSGPGLFLLAAATEFAHTGDTEHFTSLRGRLLRTLEWMKSNADDEGFYRYVRRAPKGLKNQGWKDSDDAILYPDGRRVEGPIAMCDIQGLYYAGKQAVALAFAATGECGRAARLLEETHELKRRFNERFWMPEQRYFALALDSDKHQVRSIASDPGACLAYGIVDQDKAGAVVERLMAPDMCSGWGIRTLSSAHPAYNPFGYHIGSVWPSPNSIAAYGFKRYGFDAALHSLTAALFSATRIFDLDRLPEVFGGHSRDERHPHPGIYPGACSPQAWSAAAIILLTNTMLGLLPLAPRNTLVIDPVLPEWLPEVTLKNLRVAQRWVELRFRRDHSGRTDVDVLNDGGVRIIRLPPRDAAHPAGADRLKAALAAAAE